MDHQFNGAKPKILIGGQNSISRRGVRQILEGETIQAAVGEAANFDSLLKLIVEKAWDLVVLDVNLSHNGRINVLKELRENNPAIPVLMIGMDPDDEYADFYGRAGACGYVNIQKASEMLAKTVIQILG
jgi:two-component system invasion response regulator UvrY